MYLDEVLWFFPELKIVMQHGGEPWQFECVKLMLKWPNLYYSTSAFAPRHYPKDIIQYANTRGSDRVMFAGYWPGLDIERVAKELENDVPLREHVWPKFLHDNAAQVYKIDEA
jgi:predicted TIM-barrel fold metal-dependent hydrolase